MAHHPAKLAACANCQFAFPDDQPNEFCPRCGQQNHELSLRFGHVLEETLEGLFHFDGKVFRTAKLLLFKPGELTRRFLHGHRVPYVPPVRLYVFISFVFFFMLSAMSGHHGNKPLREEYNEKKSKLLDNSKLDTLAGGKTVRFKAGNGAAQVQLDTAAVRKLRAAAAKEDDNLPVNFELNGKVKMSDIAKLPDDASAAQIDSLIRAKGGTPNFWSRLTVQRNLRWRDASLGEIVHQGLRSLSLMLFVLMPLAALLLKLFYFRQHRPYLSHLIFTIHMHCFIFVALALALLLDAVRPVAELSGWMAMTILPYFVLALRRVYAQGWFKTIAKTMLLGFSYSLALALSLSLVIAVGVAMF